ncbi:MAG: M48 family metalloprotease [Candidatus Korobacteraceae bacterium]
MFASVRLRSVAAVLVLALAVPADSLVAAQTRTATPTVPQPKGFNVFSTAQDIQLGQQYSQEVNQQLPILPENNAISQYVKRLGESLVAQLPETPYQFTFRVVQQKDINAFAIPGGPVYINMGIIESASNEAEVAGVMGHEIAHIYMRHSTRQASKQVLAQAPLAVLGGVLGGSAMGQLAQMGIGFGLNSVFMKYSRDAESESDTVGTVLMYKAGYNPSSAADFFEKLKQEGGARGPEFLSSHPDPGNREAAIRKQIAPYPARSYRQDNAQFNRIKAEVARTRSYTAEELAAKANTGQSPNGQSGGQASQQPVSRPAAADIKPSQSTRTFTHDAFHIAYPQNWQLQGDRSSAVTIAPKGGTGDNSVAYGVIINGAQRQSGSSLDADTRNLIKGMQQSNPDMRQNGNLETIRINGVTARSAQFTSTSPVQGNNGKPLRERDWLVVVPRGDNELLFLVFVAPEPDYPQLQAAFERMLRSFRLQ